MRKIPKICSLINLVLLIFITALIFIAVIYRYLFNKPILFSFELSTVLFAWMIFTGAYLSEIEHGHVGFDLLIEHTKNIANKILFIVKELVSIIILMIIIYYGIKISVFSGMKLTAMDISIRYLYFSCPIGLSFVLLGKITNLVVKK